MQEEKFIEELARFHWDKGGITQGIYWGLDDNNEVILDEEEILNEFKEKLDEVKNILGIN